MYKKLQALVFTYFGLENASRVEEELNLTQKDTTPLLHSLGIKYNKDGLVELAIEHVTKEIMERDDRDDYGFCLLVYGNDDVVLDGIYFKPGTDVSDEQVKMLTDTIENLLNNT